MRLVSSAGSCARASCRLDPGYRRTWPSHVDRCHNNVYATAWRSSSRSPPWGMNLEYSHLTAAPCSRGGLDEYHSPARDRRPFAVWNERERPRLGGGPRRGALADQKEM